MITSGTSDNLDLSVDSFLAQFPAGLEEEETSNATNKENTLSEELLPDEFDVGLGAELIESQKQKQEEHQDQQEHQEEQEDEQTVNISPE